LIYGATLLGDLSPYINAAYFYNTGYIRDDVGNPLEEAGWMDQIANSLLGTHNKTQEAMWDLMDGWTVDAAAYGIPPDKDTQLVIARGVEFIDNVLQRTESNLDSRDVMLDQVGAYMRTVGNLGWGARAEAHIRNAILAKAVRKDEKSKGTVEERIIKLMMSEFENASRANKDTLRQMAKTNKAIAEVLNRLETIEDIRLWK